MRPRTVLLMLICVVMAVGTAAAQEIRAQVTPTAPDPGLVPPDTAPDPGLVPPDDVVPAKDIVETPSTVIGDVTGLAEDTTGIPIPIDGLAGPALVEVGASPPTPAERPQSFGEQAAAIAVPAAASGLVALTFGAVALGGEGLRLLQARIAGSIMRLLRVAAGLGLAVPLFSRIERGAVLDNAQRARVHEAIAQDPGLSLSEVAARAGIAWGTTVHHLRRLEQHGMVVSVRELGHRRFFIANTPAAAQRSAMSVVMHPTARRIAEFVAHRPGTNQAGICQALGLNNPAASKHLGHFEERGLVVAQRSGRSRHYHPTGGLHSALLLLEPTPVIATRQVSRASPVSRAIPPLVAA